MGSRYYHNPELKHHKGLPGVVSKDGDCYVDLQSSIDPTRGKFTSARGSKPWSQCKGVARKNIMEMYVKYLEAKRKKERSRASSKKHYNKQKKAADAEKVSCVIDIALHATPAPPHNPFV
jgi:hypothetical protein